MSDPQCVTVVRTSSSTPTEANYRITLVTSHTPHTHITFTTTLAQQETRLLVTLLSHDLPAKQPGNDVTTTTTPLSTGSPVSDDSMYLIVVVVTIVAVVLATCVICAAIKQGSGTPKSGFKVHLLPKHPAAQAAFTPSTPRSPFVQQQATPPLSSGGSAFRRPASYSPSPQHGLFSQ